MMTAVAFAGISAFPFLPVASLPQVDFPTIQIQATLTGASAETMAASVAAPLERQFSQISGITQLTSQSTLGATEVVIQFDLNRNIDSAAQDVQAAIIAAGKLLPQSMTNPPTYKKINPADAPILTLSLRSETLPLPIVQENADNFLIPAISQVSGVARISVGGERKPSIRIQIDPTKLAASGLTLEEVRTSIVGATTTAAKGTINTASNAFTISANDQISEAQPFEDVVLAYRNGAPIRIRDVGRAVAEASNRNVAAYQNNDPGILINVHKQPGANVIETVEQIKAQLPRLTAKLPPAMTVDIILDRTQTIRASVHEVEFTLELTVALVILVILLFLRNVWATIIPGLTIPMALVIAIGFVVDDAIVVVENIYRHMERGVPAFEAAVAGSREIAFTVLSISASLVAVFIPLFLMGGTIGRLFREFALTVTASVAVSCLVSLTLAPMLCSRFLKVHSEHHGLVYRTI